MLCRGDIQRIAKEKCQNCSVEPVARNRRTAPTLQPLPGAVNLPLILGNLLHRTRLRLEASMLDWEHDGGAFGFVGEIHGIGV